jgi:hypothetical protein
MSSLAKTVSFDANTMWVDFLDSRKLGVPLAYFPRLLNAGPAQREQYEISGGAADCTGMRLMRISALKTCYSASATERAAV